MSRKTALIGAGIFTGLIAGLLLILSFLMKHRPMKCWKVRHLLW